MTIHSRSRVAAGTGAVALAAALTLVGAAPAHAHTGSLYVQSMGDGNSFATISTTDAAVTPLPTPTDIASRGIEIWDDQAYAIAPPGNVHTLYRWDHTTGAITTETELTLEPGRGELEYVSSLDTASGGVLPDGTLLSIVTFDSGDGSEQWVASIDPATAVISPLIYFSDIEGTFYLDSLATDPTTGTTWAFVDPDVGVQHAYALDFTTRTHGDPVPMEGLWHSVSTGYIAGADFDESGTLWFIYLYDSAYLVHLDGPVGVETTATAVGEVPPVATYSLAWDHGKRLADTGLELVNPAIAALALLGLGGAVLLVSRRKAAA